MASGDALLGLLLRRPAGKLRQPRAARAAGRVEIADDHVVEQDVVQPAGAEMSAHQMRMDVEHRQLGQGLFQFFHQERYWRNHRRIDLLVMRWYRTVRSTTAVLVERRVEGDAARLEIELPDELARLAGAALALHAAVFPLDRQRAGVADVVQRADDALEIRRRPGPASGNPSRGAHRRSSSGSTESRSSRRA